MQLKKPKLIAPKFKKSFANYLTITRMVLIVPYILFFALAFLSQAFLILNFVIFIIAMITDFFDGYLARKWRTVSTFGKLFDPLADKIMITSTLIYFAALNYTFIWMVILFVVRDLIVDGSRSLLAAYRINIAASIWGKLKTVTQIVAIIFVYLIVLSYKNWFTDLELLWVNAPMFIALFFSYFSGALYMKPVVKILLKKTA